MNEPVGKWVLVTGTGDPRQKHARETALRVGASLAEHGFGLVSGNALGVDKAVSEAFCRQASVGSPNRAPRFVQVCLPWYNRGGLWPGRSFVPPRGAEIKRLAGEDEWLEAVHSAADAAVILSGRAGTFKAAQRFIRGGKPVFPIPFTGGTSSWS